MKVHSSAIATALLAAAFVVSLVARPRPDPLPELCTERAEDQLRRLEEAMRFPPALTPNEIDARKEIKGNLISACIADASRRAGGTP